MSVSFLHLSDLHFLADYSRARQPLRQVLEAMQPPLEQLETLLRGLPRRPDFAVITGDLCNGGELADYRALKDALDGLFVDIPYFTTPGNHDRPEPYQEVFLSGRPLNHTETAAGVRILCLNSMHPRYADGFLSDEALDWAHDALQAPAGEDATLLITHHHLLPGQFVLSPAAGCDQLAQLLAAAPVTAVLCGHTHHFFTGSIGSCPYYTADSVSFCGENDPSGEIAFWQNSGLTFFELDDGLLSCVRLRLPGARLLVTLRPSAPLL